MREAQATGDAGAELRYLTLLGNGIAEFGRPEQALGMFDRALAVAQREKDLQEPMLTYSGKATALVALGRSSEAKRLLEHALDVARETKSIGYQADLLMQLGLLANKTGQAKDAELRFREAARLGEQAGGWRAVSQARFELSKLYQGAGDLAAAEEEAKQSIAASRRVGDRFYLPRYLARQADIQVKRGRVRDAQAAYAEAEDLINGLLVNVSSIWTKSSLIGTMNDVFLGHFRYEAEHGRNNRTAFRIVEEARGRPITDILRARPKNQAPPPAELTAAERQITGLQIELQKTSGRRERQRVLDRLFESEESMARLSTAANRWMRVATRPVGLEELQRVLQPGELLLEFVLDEPNSYCLIISRSSASLRKLAGRAEVDRNVDLLLKTVRDGQASAASARRLYDLLLKPVNEETRRVQRLIIVPDGSLHRIPFEVLMDESGKVTLQSHIVSYSPSGSVLTLLRTRKASDGGQLPLLAVSASSGDQSNPGANGAAKAFAPVERGVYDIENTEMIPLPAANGEVREVASILGSQSVVLINATEADVKAQPLQKFAVLHFAVHGLTSTKFPDRSTLILRSDETRREDELLQAREILTLRLDADLVTLSACDSGSGSVAGQEGVASLARPFLVAGAKSVVANLWGANDDFSRTLMKALYTHLAAGLDDGAAMRQAKMEMIQRFGDRATPYLWGGFIVVGDSTAKLRHLPLRSGTLGPAK
jgi:CHAT domain-containing protein